MKIEDEASERPFDRGPPDRVDKSITSNVRQKRKESMKFPKSPSPSSTNQTQPVFLSMEEASVLVDDPAVFQVTMEPSKPPVKEVKPKERIKLRDAPGVGAGKAHSSASPARFDIKAGKNLVHGSIVCDTGSGVGLIDKTLLKSIEFTNKGRGSLFIRGIGRKESQTFVVIKMELDAVKHGKPVCIEFNHEFWVVDELKCGMILGNEFLNNHDISINVHREKAWLPDGSTWKVKSHRKGLKQPRHHSLIASKDTTIPGRHHQWVPFNWDRSPGKETTLLCEPTLYGNESTDAWFSTQCCLVKGHQRHILVTNLADREIVVPKNLVLTLASECSSETIPVSSFVLDPHADGRHEPLADAWASDIRPFDQRDEEDFHDSPAPRTTVKVDNIFNVGKDPDSENPPSELVDTLRKNIKAFSLDGKPGHVAYEGMKIPLQEGAKLSPEPPRRISPEKRDALNPILDSHLEGKVIEPSKSPTSYPVTMIMQNGKWRFCVDYRNLNSKTIDDRYPLQRADDLFDTLQGNCWFSGLDAVKGYHQLEIAVEDRWKTAFACHRGLFQFTRVPFGLKGAPAHFQRFMDTLLGDMRWRTALVYLDDVIVFTKTLKAHVRALDQLLERAIKVGLKFDPAKCHFGLSSMKMLGRLISPSGVSVLPDRAELIRSLKEPTTYAELHHIIGLLDFYRGFVPRYCDHIEHLQRLSEGLRYEKSFNGRKSSTLVAKDGRRGDARKWTITWSEKEANAFEHLKSSIARAVELAFPDSSKRFFLYIDACKNAFAAALHQQFIRPLREGETESIVADPLHQMTKAELSVIRDAQATDTLCKEIIRSLKAGEPRVGYGMIDDLVYSVGDDTIFLPKKLFRRFARAAHEDLAHPGFTRTFAKLSAIFYHPKLAEMVRSYVKHCPECIKTKPLPRVGEMKVDIDDLGIPFHTISLDLMLGLPTVEANGMKFDACLIILDTFTKTVLLEPTNKTLTADNVVSSIEQLVMRKGFTPRRIITDHDNKFIGKIAQNFAKSINAVIAHTAPHHQQSNPVERYIQTAQSGLRSLCIENGVSNWLEQIPSLERALNMTPSTVTGYSPFELLYSTHPRMIDAVLEHAGIASAAEKLSFSRAKIQQAEDAVIKARYVQKARFDGRHRPLPELKVGDLVMWRIKDRPVPGVRLKNKLEPPLEGPFKVKEVLSEHRLRLDLPPEMKVKDLVDISQVQPLVGNDEYGRPGLLPNPEFATPAEIVGKRTLQRGKQFRVRWFGSSRMTWEWEEDVLNDEFAPLIRRWNANAIHRPAHLQEFFPNPPGSPPLVVYSPQLPPHCDEPRDAAQAPRVEYSRRPPPAVPPLTLNDQGPADATRTSEAPTGVPASPIQHIPESYGRSSVRPPRPPSPIEENTDLPGRVSSLPSEWVENDVPVHESASDALDKPIRRPVIRQIDGQHMVITEKPVAFSSTRTSKMQSALVGPELELAGLAWAFEKFRHLLEGARVTVVTDHAPLEAIVKAKTHKILTPNLGKARLQLAPYVHNFTFVFREGRSHSNVDALSRLPVPDET